MAGELLLVTGSTLFHSVYMCMCVCASFAWPVFVVAATHELGQAGLYGAHVFGLSLRPGKLVEIVGRGQN